MTNVVVTGASGLLGGRVVEALRDAGHSVLGVIRRSPAPRGVGARTADLTDASEVNRALGRERRGAERQDSAGERFRAEAVIHAAALANPDACERDPEEAERQNVLATAHVVAAARAISARVILVSTDLVFGGSRAWSTDLDSPAPLSVYGRTKVAAERCLGDAPSAGDAVVRVSLLSGRGFGPRRSASEALVDGLAAGLSLNSGRVRLYADEWRTPADIDDVAKALMALIDEPGLGGIFHLGGADRITRADMGRLASEWLGQRTSHAPPPIEETSRMRHRGAPRPEDVSLDSSRAVSLLGYRPARFVDSLTAGRPPLTSTAT